MVDLVGGVASAAVSSNPESDNSGTEAVFESLFFKSSAETSDDAETEQKVEVAVQDLFSEPAITAAADEETQEEVKAALTDILTDQTPQTLSSDETQQAVAETLTDILTDDTASAATAQENAEIEKMIKEWTKSWWDYFQMGSGSVSTFTAVKWVSTTSADASEATIRRTVTAGYIDLGEGPRSSKDKRKDEIRERVLPDFDEIASERGNQNRAAEGAF
ncbi:hypothetical protein T281_07850 [Rhodomicrobium udaipurense JA643]|uniref:Uncharacterized protein n=1 Tax=Rhodomicrobium udaipurense TaxID=1202716 RepID=A0A8I1KIU8_9HYPH|nr:hypothetical protein [Rhodomicrobium udaipurense]KAI95026.1 hypothetical protein T281_07850 [Rhodomicrobium udaipurense JA643]MBJ7543042.1 hypothetical protein [Rhodomicrobium udaipurense]